MMLGALVVAVAPPAEASHGPACLDLTPETDFNPTGTQHIITATLRSAGTPPSSPTQCNGAVVERGFPVNIDFEIYGTAGSTSSTSPNDTDTGDDPVERPADPPSGPDLTCTIAPGSTSCTVVYVGNNVGKDTIRGWVDEDNSDGTHEGDPTEAPGADSSPPIPTTFGETVEPDATDVVEKTWAASRLDCEPETDTNPAGSSHEITCTARDADGDLASGQNIDVEFIGANDTNGDSRSSRDATCTTGSAGEGQCKVTHNSASTGDTGTTTYVAWVDTDNTDSTVEADPNEGRDDVENPPDQTDVMEKAWIAATAAQVDCDDETGDDAETNLQGDSETYICTVQDTHGNPVAGVSVDGENMNGANDPDDDATGGPESTADYGCADTGTDGRCTIVVPGTKGDGGSAETGPAQICFWIDDPDDDNIFDVGGDPEDGGKCEDGPADEGEFGPPADGQSTVDEEENNDESDKVRKTWASSSAGDTSGGVDAQPEVAVNDLGDFHVVTIKVYDQFSRPVTSNTTVNVEFFMGSPTDRDSNTPNSPDDSCKTEDSSTPGDDSSCSIRYRAPQTRAGKDLLCVWIGQRPPLMVGDNTNGLCDAEGRADPTGDDGAPIASNDRIDVVEKYWSASFLDCSPEDATKQSGEQHTVTCKATNRNGEPVQGQHVDAEATGAGDPDNPDADSKTSPDFTCTTAASGECSFNHTGTSHGETTYTAWTDRDQNNATVEAETEPADAPENDNRTDVVTATWTASELDCEPETDDNPVGDTHTITCTAMDADGAGVPGTEIDGEATGAGDPDGNDDLTNPDFSCPETDAQGECEFTHTSQETGTTTYRFWIDDDRANSTADADEGEGVEADAEPNNPAQQGDSPEGDDTDVVEKNWIGPGLDCTPETDTNPTGTNHTVTCFARDSEGRGMQGVEIDFELSGANDPDDDTDPPPDFSCTTAGDNSATTDRDETGSCSITHFGAEPGTTVYRAWMDTDGNDNNDAEADQDEEQDENNPVTGDSENTDVVEKTWTTLQLECTPETDSNPNGTNHAVTCTAEDTRGIPLGGAAIDVEATGANDPDDSDSPETPDFMCTTSRTGECTFTHGPGGTPPTSTTETGVTLYRAWIDADGNHSSTPPTHGTVEADRTEGRNEATTPGTKAEPDDTDVVEKTWRGQRLDCEPENSSGPSGSAHTITCTATTENAGSSTAVSGTNIDFEATGANDPDDSNTPGSPDFTCTTNNEGRCSITHGPGGTGRTSNGGVTTYRAWVDVDKNDATVEADTAEGRNEATQPGDSPEPDGTDVVERVWQAAPLDCSPEVDGNPVGSGHTIQCVAEPNKNLDIEATGANDPDGGDSKTSPDFTCTTNNSGTCSITHGPGGSGSTTAKGTTTYRAWIDRDGSDSTSEADATEGRNESTTPGSQAESDETDVVEKNWVNEVRTVTLSPDESSAAVGTCAAYTITATDASNQPVAGVVLDVEQLHERSGNGTQNDEPTVLFCTPSSSQGPNPSGVDQTRGDLDPPEENPDDRGTLGGETMQATNAGGQVTIGIRVEPGNGSDGIGRVTLTAFLDADADSDPDQNEPKDTSTHTWRDAQCGDGVDNDGDGATDHPADPDCTGPEDDSEQGAQAGSRDEPTELGIRYVKRKRLFKGLVKSEEARCESGRRVTLKKRRPGRDRVLGRDRSDAGGRWVIKQRARQGRYYAVVKRKSFLAADGTTVNCLRDSSRTIRRP